MSKLTFMELCEKLAPIHQCQNTCFRDSISVHKWVAIVLWALFTSDRDMFLANHFGIGRSTVGIVVMEVCEAINTVVYPWVVAIRNFSEIIAGFQRLEFLNCAGAIDDTYILIVCPSRGSSE